MSSLGEPKLQTTCLCDDTTRARLLEQNWFSREHKFLLPIQQNIVFFKQWRIHKSANKQLWTTQDFIEKIKVLVDKILLRIWINAVVNTILNLYQWQGKRLPIRVYDIVTVKYELKFIMIYGILKKSSCSARGSFNVRIPPSRKIIVVPFEKEPGIVVNFIVRNALLIAINPTILQLFFIVKIIIYHQSEHE